MVTRRAVGRNVLRKEGHEKVTGLARYIDDIRFDDVLYVRTIRSTVPAGEIANIRYNFDPAGFTVVDHRDIPGQNIVALIDEDQPSLAATRVRHVAEPIVLLAHADRTRLAAAEVAIDYRETTPNFDPERSDVSFKSITIEKGRLDQGMAQADVIVEGEYRAGHQEQLYIEPNGVVAVPEHGGVTLYGSLQCPYYVHRALTVLLGLPPEKVRVVQTETGGGFGGKEEYPSMIAGHAALVAMKSGRPAKLIYDRVEDMLATTKRHPAIVRHRTGVKKDGRLTAMEIDVVLDGGAYATLSAVVLSRGMIHASGPYRCDHIRARGRATMTNTPPNGAFRGFGAPQTQFAVEAHMDAIAERLGIDPLRLRERNALRPGDTTATGQKVGKDCSALQVLREAGRRTAFSKKRRALKGSNRGIGLSLFFHGSGFTGGGEVKLASKASLALTERGVQIRVASTEIGQGTRTMHAQIVADTLGIPYDQVEVSAADTATVPDSGPTVASRTCMIVGRLLQRCAEDMRDAPRTPDAGRLLEEARRVRRHQTVPEAARPRMGRRHVSRRCLRQLRMGLRRRRSGSRSDHLSGDAGGVYHRPRDWPGDSSDAGGRTDRGRIVPGARLRAARRGRDARRQDGQRAADQLHHPDDARHAADDDQDSREPLHARSVRCKRCGRDADRRTGARGRQRAQARGSRRVRDSCDAGEDHEGEGQEVRRRRA